MVEVLALHALDELGPILPVSALFADSDVVVGGLVEVAGLFSNGLEIIDEVVNSNKILFSGYVLVLLVELFDELVEVGPETLVLADLLF